MDHRIYKFLIVVQEGNFLKAAKKLKISQPAVTLAITSLEIKLGHKLFLAKKPLIKLSKYGEVVYESAIRIDKEANAMIEKLHSLKDQKIKVGIIDSIAYWLYADSKNNIMLNEIETMVDNSRLIINDIIDQKLNYGIITGFSSNMPDGIKFQQIGSEEFVFVTSPKNEPALNGGTIDNWLAFNRTSNTYKIFEQKFIELGLKVKPIFYSTSMELLKDLAIEGRGVALLPKNMVKRDLKSRRLLALDTPTIYRPIFTVARQETDSQFDVIKNLRLALKNYL